MKEVSTYMGEVAQGVPYIVIGDKVFPGYANSYDEDIKSAIVDLYKTTKKKRYDVFTEMKKNPNKNSASISGSVDNKAIWVIIICNMLATGIACYLTINHVDNRTKELKSMIADIKKYPASKEKTDEKKKK